MRLSMKFQTWLLALVCTLVFGMTAVFLAIAMGQFQSVAQSEAQARFELLARQVAAPLQADLLQLSRKAQAEAHLDPEAYAHQGHVQAQTLVPLWMSSLREHPDLSSQYLGLPNDEFVQVIALRGQARWVQALEAPGASYFAVRTITQDADGARTERWVFRDAQGAVLAERAQAARYRPSQRDWFIGAQRSQGAFVSDAYTYASTDMLGLTIAAALPDGAGVYGMDLTLDAIGGLLAGAEASPNALLALVDGQGRVLGFHGRGERYGALRIRALQPLRAHEDARVQALAALLADAGRDGAGVRQLDRESLVYAFERVGDTGSGALRLLVAAPLTDFTGSLRKVSAEVWLSSLLLLLLLVPLALLGTRRVTRALAALAGNAERLQALDFSDPPRRDASFVVELNALGQAQEVARASLRHRTQALDLARRKLAQIVDNGIRMGRERDRDALLRHVLFGARDIAHCHAATLFLRTEHGTLKFALRTSEDPLPDFEVPLHDAETGAPVHRYVSAHVALTAESVVIDDVYAETRFDLAGTKQFSEASGLRVVSMLTVPLFPREGEVIGVLQLINCLDPVSGAVVPFDPETVGFIEALATQSAVTIENQNLLLSQKALMDAMIKIIAGAIDAKSAYTGGHCARVPELAMMLAEEATKVQDGPLAGFAFKTEDEWSEFRIGAWLHDCGKVTTPEYVVDKATKLETIYNRIHEVRTRFEVLLRDAEIAAHKAVAAGQDAAAAWAAYAARQQQLREDFAFVAETNLGGEFMDPGRMERIRAIAEQTWLRHFDDRLGLSQHEEERLAGVPAPGLPAEERLLADKPQHIVPRGEDRALDPRYGFQVRVPQHLYHHGEVYNLGIARGTLTEEERFKINEHIIQTIVMLDGMPFPKHLQRVPEYAGTHHETLTGSGYPRKLAAEQLSVPARIMAIADIFEALTASDRPYKKAKTLSESVRILSFFKKDGHIDPVLFDLFLSSGVYRRYAERFLAPGQIDAVDIAPYLG